MKSLNELADVRRLLVQRGHERYDGEPVSHLNHACQAATLAQRAGAADALIAAALLHDIGHLVTGHSGTPSADGIDDRHEVVAAHLLAPWLPLACVAPIAGHVLAKRCLAVNPNYLKALSEDSRRSLTLQGGPMNEAERLNFLSRPFARESMRLRHWDDAAKMPHYPTLPFAQLWASVERCAQSLQT
ncbi:MAG: HD domain-containing protein [Ideonella sp.]|nr:HD domain-containing protein [Ideonella sp.]